jgi:hypothetical protein
MSIRKAWTARKLQISGQMAVHATTHQCSEMKLLASILCIHLPWNHQVSMGATRLPLPREIVLEGHMETSGQQNLRFIGEEGLTDHERLPKFF